MRQCGEFAVYLIDEKEAVLAGHGDVAEQEVGLELAGTCRGHRLQSKLAFAWKPLFWKMIVRVSATSCSSSTIRTRCIARLSIHWAADKSQRSKRREASVFNRMRLTV